MICRDVYAVPNRWSRDQEESESTMGVEGDEKSRGRRPPFVPRPHHFPPDHPAASILQKYTPPLCFSCQT